MTPRWLQSLPPSRLRLLVNLLGLAILIGGVALGLFILQAQNRVPQRAPNEADPLALQDSKKDSQQMEIYYGKTGLLVSNLTQWAQSLTHGKGLAISLIVISATGAIGCFIYAGRVENTP